MLVLPFLTRSHSKYQVLKVARQDVKLVRSGIRDVNPAAFGGQCCELCRGRQAGDIVGDAAELARPDIIISAPIRAYHFKITQGIDLILDLMHIKSLFSH